LEDVRPRHIQNMIDGLAHKDAQRRKGKLAPRTIRHVYGTIAGLFMRAEVEELIRVSPCGGRKIELPPVMDKDPSWREGAVFSRTEVEALIGDERLPLEHRELNGLLFCAGLRFSEIAALTWRDWTPDMEPLGRLVISKAWNTNRKKLGRPKSKRARLVPVHPALAKMLAARKLRMGGTDDAPMFPLRSSTRRRSSDVARFASVADAYKGLVLKDLAALGFRRRRLHDTRRTFKSLTLSDGARPEILRLVTHGPGGSVEDLYTSIPWQTLCEVVQALKVRPRAGDAVLIPALVPVTEKAQQFSADRERAIQDSNLWPSAPEADALSS
jgi:integrase